MRAIQATPKTVRELFNESYVIPNFQRPYSWEKDKCETLWMDILNFHSSLKDDKEQYYLGTIVVYPNETDKRLSVIDGQQRLTSLLLLVKALFSHASTVTALERCIFLENKLSGEKTDELRIVSKVIAQDFDDLKAVVFNDETTDAKTPLVTNHSYFHNQVGEWIARQNDSEKLENFIISLLDNVVILPIRCETQDDALTIFETINDRGQPLSDADIFKAKLYNSAPTADRDSLIARWNNLDGHDSLFRQLMHVYRAQAGDTTSEVSLRSYFTNGQRLAEWDKTLTSLEKLNLANRIQEWTDLLGYSAVSSLYGILKTHSNNNWSYPVYVFLHKYGELIDDAFHLSRENADKLEKLLRASIRYNLLMGTVHNTVGAVRDTIYKVYVKIEAASDYLKEYADAVSTDDLTIFEARLGEGAFGKRYKKAYILLASFLNPNQKMDDFSNFIWAKYDLEHTLPVKWNDYDAWDSGTHAIYLNSLGNMYPLEKSVNIHASNEYFKRKKEKYASSKVQDILDLRKIADAGWIPKQVEAKESEKLERLKTFFIS